MDDFITYRVSFTFIFFSSFFQNSLYYSASICLLLYTMCDKWHLISRPDTFPWMDERTQAGTIISKTDEKQFRGSGWITRHKLIMSNDGGASYRYRGSLKATGWAEGDGEGRREKTHGSQLGGEIQMRWKKINFPSLFLVFLIAGKHNTQASSHCLFLSPRL